MIKSGFKALLLSGLIFLSSSFYFVNAEPRAIDYSQTINSDFTKQIAEKPLSLDMGMKGNFF